MTSIYRTDLPPDLMGISAEFGGVVADTFPS